MTAFGQSVFLQSLGWAVLNSLWQMALLWVVFQLVSGTVKGMRSGQKTTLASILLFAGFAWFLYTFFIVLFTPSHNNILIDSFAASSGNEKVADWFRQTLPAAAFAYMILLLFPILHFRRNYRYVKVIRNHGLSKIHVDWRIFTKKMAALIGIKKPVQVWLSDFVSSPLTVGFLKPVILIPAAAVNHLTMQQMEAVLLHELAHIRRNDYLLNIVINGIQTLLYFNPFVKLFVKTIEREREKSCDETVVQFQYDRRGYATALLLIEKTNHLTKPLAVAATGNKNDLLHRVEKILGIDRKPVFSFNRLAGLFAGLLFIIGLNAVLILNKPVNGEKPSVSLSHISSPFYLLTGERWQELENQKTGIDFGNLAVSESPAKSKEAAKKEIKKEAIVEKQKKIKVTEAKNDHYFFEYTTPVPVFVNFTQPVIAVPELKQYQELQVKKALDASKTIIEEAQWKAVEKNIADALTKVEKEQVKTAYQHLFENVNWKMWEDKLKLSYNKIDWEKVNEELNTALTKIKLDSLQHVYLEAARNLHALQQCLKENNQNCIPDSDITLQKLEENEQQLKKALKTIDGMKTRKIIRL